MNRELILWINDHLVGVLREQQNLWQLSYDASWQASETGFDLAPALRRAQGNIVDGATTRPVQWFFDNLLPEEGARALLAQEAGIEQADAFGLLERYGMESAGALTLLQPGQAPTPAGARTLPDAMLSERIQRLPRQSLSLDAPKRMSMAGAQHKLAVILDGPTLLEPVGQMPSTHILKPDHVDRDRYPHTVANEWFTMRLARRLGLPVPDVELRRIPEPVYLVERFDRIGAWPDQQRIHLLDACQLLSLDRIYKYQEAKPATLVRLIALTRTKAVTRQALFRWLIFNVLVGNGDAHLKNLSFFLGPTGIELAPHYDLLSTAVYAQPGQWGHTELSWPMGECRFSAELTRHSFITYGEAISLPKAVSSRLLDEMLDRIEPEADKLLDAIANEVSHPSHAGELRLLRTIRFGVIRDQVITLKQHR